MDVLKLSAVFDQLKGLLSTHRSGQQWASGDEVPTPAGPAFGAPPGALENPFGASNWEILENAEAQKLWALGPHEQTRLRRRDKFVCSAEVATEPFSLQCLGGMELHGECLLLNQTLLTKLRHLQGRRTLLALGEHVGRRLKLHWKLIDGMNYQVCHTAPGSFEVRQHLQTCIWLDQVPEPYNGTGYLCVEFQ